MQMSTKVYFVIFSVKSQGKILFDFLFRGRMDLKISGLTIPTTNKARVKNIIKQKKDQDVLVPLQQLQKIKLTRFSVHSHLPGHNLMICNKFQIDWGQLYLYYHNQLSFIITSTMASTSQSKVSPIFKVVIGGDSGVGKTNILSRYINNNFFLAQNTTIGIQFSVKQIKKGDETIKMQIWDTAGQDRYRSMSSIFYKNAVGALIVFDLGSRKSFEGTARWIKEIREQAVEGIVLLLIGNKSDLPQRQITTEQALLLAHKEGMGYFQTSAALNKNIGQSFQKISQQIYKKYKHDKETQPQNTEPIKPVKVQKNKKQIKKSKQQQSRCCA